MPDGRRLIPLDRLAELRKLAEGCVVNDAPFEMAWSEFLQLLDHIDTLAEALDVEDVAYCEVCGCTQNNACEGGCDWAADGLCSSCRYQVVPAEDGAEDGSEGWQVDDLLEGKTLGDDLGPCIYMDRAVAERSAELGQALYQRMTCVCGWDGTSRETETEEILGQCPRCGESDGLRGLEEYVEAKGDAGHSPQVAVRGEDGSPQAQESLPTPPALLPALLPTIEGTRVGNDRAGPAADLREEVGHA